MAFKLYVGNYPFTFTETDVQNLFRDFDDVKLEKLCCSPKNSKSFAFLTCNSIDLLVSVIKKMNRTPVSGRNLIVRASDASLQEYVSLILQNEVTSEKSSPMKVLRNKCRPQYRNIDPEKSDSQDRFHANNKLFEKCSTKNVENFGANSKHFEKSSKSEDNSDANSKCFGKQPPKNGYNFDSNSKCFGKRSPKSEDNFDANSKCFEKRPPKSEDNFENLEKKFTSSSRLMHDVYQLQSNVNDCETSPNNPHFSSKIGNMLNDQTLKSNNQSYKSNACSSRSSSNSYQSSNDNNERDYFETRSNHYFKSSHNNYHQTPRQINASFPGNITPESQKYCQPKSESCDHDQFNNFSRYSYNNTGDTHSQASRNKNVEHFYEQRDTGSPTWISVTNFPIGINADALYDLFSDYTPLRVKMICNRPRKDRMLAEAHVCFPNREIADDVILNFDNTMFEGRLILVTDVEDLTIMNELLNISHS